jgi:hypothetical protein
LEKLPAKKIFDSGSYGEVAPEPYGEVLSQLDPPKKPKLRNLDALKNPYA